MIFFIFGTDHYQAAEKLKELKAGFNQKRDKAGLNVVNLNGEELTPNQLQQEALTVPFLGEKKIIIIKNALANKKIGSELVDFLKSNEKKIDNIICFVDFIEADKVKVDRKNKLSLTGALFKYLSTGEYVWEFNLMPSQNLTNWLNRYLAQKSIKIEPAAITELIIRVGNDLFQMVAEVDKLVALKNREKILAVDIKNNVNYKFDDNIFNLVDSLGNKNKRLALKLMSDQLNFGSHPLMILSMIIRQFKIILKTKDGGTSALKLKLHPFVFNKAKIQSRNFTKEQLIRIINKLLNLEKRLKSGEKNPELFFNLFITKNC